MTLADLPVLNPSTPGREARRAAVVAGLFAIFGALYALTRAAAAAPPDISGSTDPVFGFAFPRGWGIVPAIWTGAATWPGRLAAADMGGTMAVIAVVILAIALVIVMHPDILSRQGPQYVSPARRILTVAIAFVLAFVIYVAVWRIDDLVASQAGDGSRRRLIGYAALSLIMFGGIWSFIGPKDFGRRIPLRISHGALGGLGVWAAITFATLLSREPRNFLSSSIDTFYTLLTVDMAQGTPGATAAWAISSDILTAAVAMAVAGALLIMTAPQSLGPGNRRGAALITGVLFAFLVVVALTTNGVTSERARQVNFDVTAELQLETQAPTRAAILLGGSALANDQRIARMPVVPSTATAADCQHSGAEERSLPAATQTNITRLSAWLDSHGDEVSGASIRVASCRAALQALRWDVEAARAGIFGSRHPERIGPLTYYLAAPNIASMAPNPLTRTLNALSDTARYMHGADAAQRFADLARIAGDTAAEAAWRQRIIQPSGNAALASLLAKPAYRDGIISGRIAAAQSGWRVGLLSAADPSSGADVAMALPRAEGAVFASMISATDVGPDGRFAFSGLRDGYFMLALLGPEGSSPATMAALRITGDPGTFRLEPTRKTRDVGVIRVEY